MKSLKKVMTVFFLQQVNSYIMFRKKQKKHHLAPERQIQNAFHTSKCYSVPV